MLGKTQRWTIKGPKKAQDKLDSEPAAFTPLHNHVSFCLAEGSVEGAVFFGNLYSQVVQNPQASLYPRNAD